MEKNVTLKERIVLSIFFLYLKAREYNQTISVFSAEANVESTSLLSDQDIIMSLSLDRLPSFQNFLSSQNNKTGHYEKALIDNIIDDISNRAIRNTSDVGVQTPYGVSAELN
jgi:hypothetical protein